MDPREPRHPGLDPQKQQRILDDTTRQAFLNAQGVSQARTTGTLEGTDLSVIDWPHELVPKDTEQWEELKRLYSYDHAQKTAQLAVHIAQGAMPGNGDTPLTGLDLELVRLAALFHDLGRREPWPRADPGHAMRSAEQADRILRVWGQHTLIEPVCRLITAHTLDGIPPGDPRLQALWDAECLESARLEPRTMRGGAVMRERYDRVITRWARLPEHQRRYRDGRGWT